MSDISEEIDSMLQGKPQNKEIKEMVTVNTSTKELLGEINSADSMISHAGDILLFKAEQGDLSDREAKLFDTLMVSIEKEAKELRSRMKKVLKG